jgi:hypothetical protein
MINVNHIKDTEYEITWDKNDPVESMMNHWEEEDFIRAIREELKKDELR